VRIIGGQWRGRRLRFPASADLRPSADRLRETLFNWLAPDLPGARCLDLFAGSGALGFEAASRGAGRVVLVERAAAAARALDASRELLAATRVEVVRAPVERFLARAPARFDPERFDIVFVDPPFARPELAVETARRLAEADWLAASARVYIEVASHAERPGLPAGWCLARSAAAGDATGLLYAAPAAEAG